MTGFLPFFTEKYERGVGQVKSVILVPVDGSEHANRALHTAIQLAKAFDSPEILIMNVQPSLETFHTHLFFDMSELKKIQQEEGQKVIDGYLDTLRESGIPFRTLVEVGQPKERIHEVARTEKAVHIVIGARGLGPVRRPFLGSVSYGVLHHAPCPVTIVHAFEGDGNVGENQA